MITINNAIYALLTSSTGLTALVGTKIYPIVIPAETALPAVVIDRTSTGIYSNDGTYGFDNTINITIISTTYNESVEIANKIDEILNFYRGTVSGINIIDTKLSFVSEEYNDEGFTQKLVYNMKNY